MVFDRIKNIDEERLYGMLGYCFILCIVALIVKQDNKFVLFHGRQGLALFLMEMVGFLLSIVFPQLWSLFLFFFALFSLWGMVKALKGELFQLPIVYAVSERLVL